MEQSSSLASGDYKSSQGTWSNGLNPPAVLVPFQDKIEPETDECLRGVERLGIQVIRRPNCSAIDFARCEMASLMLQEQREAILFIDSDMLFNPQDVAYILQRPEPVVGGLYSQKGFGKINANLPESYTMVSVGQQGGDYQANGIGGGFLRIRCEVLRRLIDELKLPECKYQHGTLWPFFQPFCRQCEDGTWSYLGEDYAFCDRCTQAGVNLIVDTRIRLYHIGRFHYGCDQVGFGERPQNLTFHHAQTPDNPYRKSEK
jgi:hypothetical protein